VSTAEKNVFSGLRETLNPAENPDFKWMRDGKPFDPEERFKVLFKVITSKINIRRVKPLLGQAIQCISKDKRSNKLLLRDYN
jgi:hypothetical protein